MISPLDLFSLTLLATGGLYACMLAYFGGLVGTKRRHTRIEWNSEPVLWIIAVLLMFSVTFRIIEPAAAGSGIWYLIGTGNLIVIFIYLVIELARHDLPKAGYWLTVALTAIGILAMLANVVGALISQSLDLVLYREELAMLMVVMTHILLMVLLFNLLRSFRSSFLSIWMAKPNSPDRLKAGGVSVTCSGEVTTPEGALSYVGIGDSEGPTAAELPPGSSIVIDFGIRRIEDHGFRSDLRVVGGDASEAIEVEVSNDGRDWVACEREENILTDWDVPYFDSPWRYVRISNGSARAVQISDVFDLD